MAVAPYTLDNHLHRHSVHQLPAPLSNVSTPPCCLHLRPQVCATVEAARSSDRSEDASLTLEPATVTRVTPVGMGT